MLEIRGSGTQTPASSAQRYTSGRPEALVIWDPALFEDLLLSFSGYPKGSRDFLAEDRSRGADLEVPRAFIVYDHVLDAEEPPTLMLDRDIPNLELIE
jgi:hypothetical protein